MAAHIVKEKIQNRRNCPFLSVSSPAPIRGAVNFPLAIPGQSWMKNHTMTAHTANTTADTPNSSA